MTVSVSDGSITLRCEILRLGNDLVAALSGGDRPHIGSVSAAVPRASLSEEGGSSATVSTFNYTGHMDGRLGDAIAARLASRFRCHVAVVSGVHVEHITPEQLDTVLRLADELTEAVLKELETEQA